MRLVYKKLNFWANFFYNIIQFMKIRKLSKTIAKLENFLLNKMRIIIKKISCPFSKLTMLGKTTVFTKSA